MRTENIIRTLLILIISVTGGVCFATNPIITNIYTADPAPLVYNGRVYIYTGHDENNASGSYLMKDYRCYSSSDMINWTDHGAVLNVTAFSWASQTKDANAAQVAYRNGKFYYYVSVMGNGGIALGVAVANSPTGPFTDAIGKALVTNDQTTYASHSWDNLDPTVFIDDDGQAYLYWGNNACYWVRLNNDMISYSGSINTVPLTTAAFGQDYEEAPWLYKRNGLYYLLYAAGFPEWIAYSTSNSPAGPWTYRGIIMPRQGNSSTIHPGVIDFGGRSFFFYHNAKLPGGDSYHRAVCIEEFKYNADGTFPTINMTTAGVTVPVQTTGPTPTSAPTPTPNQNPVWSGGPYTLNGTSDYVDLPDGMSNNLGDFSIACWVKLNTLENWSRIFDFGGDTNVYMMLTPASGNTGYPYFCITTTGNSGEQGINGTSALSTGSWQHMAVVRSGNTGILYINKQEVGRNTGISLRPSDLGNTVNNYIGRSQWSNDPYLNGSVDKFVIYNRAISAAEVTTLGNNPPGGNITLGDSNDDGAINIVDALMIAQHSVGLSPAGFVASNADVNCDGTINIVDALMTAQYYVGLLSGFSC